MKSPTDQKVSGLNPDGVTKKVSTKVGAFLLNLVKYDPGAPVMDYLFSIKLTGIRLNWVIKALF